MTKNIAIHRSTKGLRDVLFEEMEALRAGSSTPARANAMARLTDQVGNTVRLEIEVQKHLENQARAGKPLESVSAAIPEIALGS